MSQQVTAIESLELHLRSRFTSAKISLDRPKHSSGIWYLDINDNGHPVVIQWQEGMGFGVSSSMSHDYGEGADEVYPNEEAVYGRVVSLLLSGKFTSGQELITLRELRKERGLSQIELASLLKRQQGEVSKIERRSDVLVSTLREVIESMEGTLKLVAKFPNTERILNIGEAAGCKNRDKTTVARN